MRPEFHARGVTFLSYFDHRAAIAAHSTLASQLGVGSHASCHFSVMLHAANNTDESRLVLKNLAVGRPEKEVESIFSRYGLLMSIQRTFDGDASNYANYTVEYFNIQDARLAASELSATSAQIWGTETELRFATLESRKVQLCKQLLAVLSRWRGDVIPTPPPSLTYQSTAVAFQPSVAGASYPSQQYGMMMYNPQTVYYPPPVPPYSSAQHQMQYGYQPYADNGMPPQYLVQPPYLDTHPHSQTLQSPEYGLVAGAQYESYPLQSHNVRKSDMNTHNQQQQNQQQHQQQRQQQSKAGFHGGGVYEHGPSATVERPQYHNGGHSSHNSNNNGYNKPGGRGNSGGNRNDESNNTFDSSDFSLDASRLQSGIDRRTTLMIRNIPNKYTQISVLEEINANHLGKYDFFYLPIDFKNRCNVGYAFINFNDPLHISSFYEEFSGHKWKNFNSEKVCQLTFARIQGKQSMISRFQNSSLLDKDDGYKPLLFVSSGPDKGRPEPFPACGRQRKSKDTTHDESDASHFIAGEN